MDDRRTSRLLLIATAVIAAAIVVLLLATLGSSLVAAADSHEGLAAWMQAIGATAAVGVAVWLSERTVRDARRVHVEAHNELVNLCANLGAMAREKTHEALLVLFGLPDDPLAPNRLAFVGVVNRWAYDLNGIADSLAQVPRDGIRDYLFSYNLSKLVRALDTNQIMGYASTSISGARDALNMRELEIGAAVEGIQSRWRN